MEVRRKERLISSAGRRGSTKLLPGLARDEPFSLPNEPRNCSSPFVVNRRTSVSCSRCLDLTPTPVHVPGVTPTGVGREKSVSRKVLPYSVFYEGVLFKRGVDTFEWDRNKPRINDLWSVSDPVTVLPGAIVVWSLGLDYRSLHRT